MFLRLLLWLLARLVYGFRIAGRQNLPRSGPVLLLANHVTYIDGIILLAASNRPIRFLIMGSFVRHPLIGWPLRRLGAIPMDRGPKKVRQALDAVTEALKRGECVCIFPEARPTRTGAMLPFQRGFEVVARDTGALIVPVWLDRLWGSYWSYARLATPGRRPRRPSDPVTVTYGASLPTDICAAVARQALNELAAEVAKERSKSVLPLHRQFLRVVRRQPGRLCLSDPTRTPKELSYAEVMAGAVCLAEWLRPRLGDAKMVGVWLPPGVGAALTNLALMLLGRVPVNLNYSAGPANVGSAICQCELMNIISADAFLAKVALEAGEGVEVLKLEASRADISDAMKRNAYLMVRLWPLGWLERRLGIHGHGPDDLATVIFSSGSTGEPKGILLSQRNVAGNIDGFHPHIRFSTDDRIVGILPFFHSFGFTVTFWGALLAGASATYHPDPRAAKEIGELCRTFNGTLMAATATFLRFFLRRCGADDFRTLRYLVCGAEKLPPGVAAEFKEKFGVEPMEGYGCTELAPVTNANMPDVEAGGVRQVCHKPGTVGHTLPGVAARVTDPETLAPLGFNAEGLVLITGPNVMIGYLGRPEETRKKIVNGWYNTGDVGKLDEDGFLTLTGRLARIAKIAGEMIPVERVEEELQKLLGTADRLLAVTAIPDSKRGERLVVLHLPLPKSPEELCAGLAKSGMPNLWQPGPRDFYLIDEMPLLGSGKLDLQKLKQLALHYAG